jgi:hypothetical protein
VILDNISRYGHSRVCLEPYPRRANLSRSEDIADAEKDTKAFREEIVEVPGGLKVRIRFERFQFKRGKMSRWFWTPYSAERVE